MNEKKLMELKIDLLEYIGIIDQYNKAEAEDIVKEEEKHDYLHEYKGNDGRAYLWYLDNVHNVAICIETEEIFEKEEIDEIFGINGCYTT